MTCNDVPIVLVALQCSSVTAEQQVTLHLLVKVVLYKMLQIYTVCTQHNFI